jgi:DNA-binding transcriptional regulator YdaS (Cro superfamily)
MNLQAFLDSEATKPDGMKRSQLARALEVHPSLISQWLSGHRPIAAEQVLPIEKATGGRVSRHDLRPDIYPREQLA